MKNPADAGNISCAHEMGVAYLSCRRASSGNSWSGRFDTHETGSVARVCRAKLEDSWTYPRKVCLESRFQPIHHTLFTSKQYFCENPPSSAQYPEWIVSLHSLPPMPVTTPVRLLCSRRPTAPHFSASALANLAAYFGGAAARGPSLFLAKEGRAKERKSKLANEQLPINLFYFR